MRADRTIGLSHVFTQGAANDAAQHLGWRSGDDVTGQQVLRTAGGEALQTQSCGGPQPRLDVARIQAPARAQVNLAHCFRMIAQLVTTSSLLTRLMSSLQ